jgi:hypothetical protein
MVIDDLHSINQEGSDVVPPETEGGPRVEEPRVLVALFDRAEFPALLPVRSILLDRSLQRLPRRSPQRSFQP